MFEKPKINEEEAGMTHLDKDVTIFYCSATTEPKMERIIETILTNFEFMIHSSFDAVGSSLEWRKRRRTDDIECLIFYVILPY